MQSGCRVAGGELLNKRFSEWQSEKYCLATELKLEVISNDLNLGGWRGEDTDSV
jgi:hypothetical protein